MHLTPHVVSLLAVIIGASVNVECRLNSHRTNKALNKQTDKQLAQQVEFIEEEALQKQLSEESPKQRQVDKANSNGFLNRSNRLFPYLNLIKFPSDYCSTSSGFGVCLAARECRAKGGNSIGSCAQGFGSCCTFKRSCNGEGKEIVIKENSTLLINSEEGSPSSCRFTFPKGRGICQLRLDFSEFQLEDGQASGNCASESLTISESENLKEPLKLCGDLKGQHIYLTYGSSDKIFLDSVLKSSNAKYSIRVSQIRCNSALTVPAYCTQFFRNESGQIKSFNFGHQQLNNQQYTICIDEGSQKVKSQGIRWKTCDDPRSFLISGSQTDSPVTNPENCKKDFIQIFGSNQQCGNSFKTVQTNAKPFLVQVNFDDIEVPEPFQCVPIPALDEASCLAETKPGVLNCLWDALLGSCCCRQVNPVTPDIDNTGFCLEYNRY